MILYYISVLILLPKLQITSVEPKHDYCPSNRAVVRRTELYDGHQSSGRSVDVLCSLENGISLKSMSNMSTTTQDIFLSAYPKEELSISDRLLSLKTCDKSVGCFGMIV